MDFKCKSYYEEHTRLGKIRITGLPVIGWIVRTPRVVYQLLSDIKT